MLDIFVFSIMSLVYVVIALILFVFRPVNIASILSFASAFFVVPPALLHIYFDVKLSYSFRNVEDTTEFLSDNVYVHEPISIVILILFLFSLSAFVGMRLYNEKRVRFLYCSKYSVYCIAFILTVAWVYFVIRLKSISNGSILEVFIPSVGKERLSYIEHSIFMSIPLVGILLVFSIGKVYFGILYYFIAMGALTCLTTHQRREIIVFIFTVLGCLIFLSDREWKSAERRGRRFVRKWQRKVIIFSLAIGSAVVPLAWYLRVFSTYLMRGDWVNPLAVRGPLELLFGSPATGVPSFLLIYNYVEKYGPQLDLLFLQLLTAVVPRSFYPTKPESVSVILVREFNLSEIPSIFWFGELYFNYAYFSILASCILGVSMATLHQKMSCSDRVSFRGSAVLILANFVTFFKNGLSIGVTRTAITTLMFLIGLLILHFLGARRASECGRW